MEFSRGYVLILRFILLHLFRDKTQRYWISQSSVFFTCFLLQKFSITFPVKNVSHECKLSKTVEAFWRTVRIMYHNPSLCSVASLSSLCYDISLWRVTCEIHMYKFSSIQTWRMNGHIGKSLTRKARGTLLAYCLRVVLRSRENHYWSFP